MTWVFLFGVSWAGPVLVRPSPPAPVANECDRSIPLTYGQPPPQELVMNGITVCNAVAEPTSSLAHLLAVEKYSIAADEVHQIDVNKLHAEIDGLRTDKPWHQTPKAQRWIGRLEVFGGVVVVAGLGVLAYNYGQRSE